MSSVSQDELLDGQRPTGQPKAGSQFDLMDLVFVTTGFALTLAFGMSVVNQSPNVSSVIFDLLNGATLAALFVMMRRVFAGRFRPMTEPGSGLLLQLGATSLCSIVLWWFLPGTVQVELAHPFDGNDKFYLACRILLALANFGILSVTMVASRVRW